MSFIEPINPDWGNPFPNVEPEEWEDEDDEQSLTSHVMAFRRVLTFLTLRTVMTSLYLWHNGERERAVPAP